MFLQSKYDKPFQQEAGNTFGGTTGFQNFKREFKSRAPIVGSTKLGRMNFERTEQVFPKEDIPKKSYEAKVAMTQLVDPDILGLRKKDWNGSVSVPVNAQEEDFERKLTKIKLGFFDTPLPKYRPNKVEAGTDTRDQYIGWNVSVQAASKFQSQNNIDHLTNYAMTKTKRAFNKINDYKAPSDTIKQFNETLRQEKRDEKDVREELKRKIRFENPAATENRINATVNRLVYENKKETLRPQSENLSEETFKPDISKTTKVDLDYVTYHNGSWGPQFPAKKEAWSCCMMDKKTGEGCVRVKVNKDKWILDSCGSAYG
jgi:hypothetical protein